MVCTCIFSFFHIVFESFLYQGNYNLEYEVNPLLNKIFFFPKLKEFADDNFNFDENGRKVSKCIKNTVEKGEIAPYQQFLVDSTVEKGEIAR